MNRSWKKLASLLLTTTLVLSVASFAYAAQPPGFLVNSKSLSTPYGTLEGRLYCYHSDSYNFEIGAYTVIDSTYTMAEVVTKMECYYNDTGESVEWSNNSLSNSAQNTNECVLGHYHYNNTGRSLAIFTTHEVTYTRSYVLYMSSVL